MKIVLAALLGLAAVTGWPAGAGTTAGSAPPAAPVLTRAEGPADLSVFRDCDACPPMVVIPGGAFTMGSPAGEAGRDDDEGPQRDVTVARFALAQTEVTFAQWQACVDGGGCRSNPAPSDAGWGRDRRPVIDVSWEEAREYTDWLNTQVPGAPYRLPSEAEWEHAARAGTVTPFAFGAEISTDRANHAGTITRGLVRTGVFRGQTVPVGDLDAANGWGLRHMHGNVHEWVEDCWHDGYRGAPVDGSAWLAGNGGDCARRVVRGGSWVDFARNLRSAYRSGLGPEGRYEYVGFRPARTLPDPDA